MHVLNPYGVFLQRERCFRRSGKNSFRPLIPTLTSSHTHVRTHVYSYTHTVTRTHTHSYHCTMLICVSCSRVLSLACTHAPKSHMCVRSRWMRACKSTTQGAHSYAYVVMACAAIVARQSSAKSSLPQARTTSGTFMYSLVILATSKPVAQFSRAMGRLSQPVLLTCLYPCFCPIYPFLFSTVPKPSRSPGTS